MFHAVQSNVLLVLGALAFGLELYALADAARRRPDAFVAAGKRTKQFWTILLAVAAAIGFVVLFSPPNMLMVTRTMLATARPRIQPTGRTAEAASPASGGAICTSAPSTMMLEMALVTLMSGVCSAAVTFHTTM